MTRHNSHRYRPRRERYISKKTKWTIALSALGVIAAALLVLAFVNGWIKLPKLPEKPVETVPATQPAADTVIHFVAGGDVNITDKVVASGGPQYQYSDSFLDILPALTAGDLTALNFEGNAVGTPYGSAMVSAPPQLLTALRYAGVDVLQTANSEALTNGLRGLAATNEAIRAAGIQPLGTYKDQAEFQQYQGYLVYEIQGIRIALVAFTKGMDGRNLPEGSESCVNLLYADYSSNYKEINEAGITAVLNAVEVVQPDITIALVHWGSEYNDQISSTQQKICKLMGSLGVDAVIGNHSHHVQSMGFDKDAGLFVAYSLGDFLGDATAVGTDYSVLLDLQITKDGATGKVSITDYDYTPIYQYYDENGSLRLLRIREALAAYENDYISKVPAEVYQAMKSALQSIEKRVKG